MSPKSPQDPKKQPPPPPRGPRRGEPTRPSDSPAGPGPRPPYPRTHRAALATFFRSLFAPRPADEATANTTAYLDRQIGAML